MVRCSPWPLGISQNNQHKPPTLPLHHSPIFPTLPPHYPLAPFPPCHLLTTCPCPHLSQLARSLPSNLSNLPAWLSCHLSHLPTFLPYCLSHLPCSLPSHLSQISTFPATKRSLYNDILPLGREGKHVWPIFG